MFKKILFLIFISLFFMSPIYPNNDDQDIIWNRGEEDLRHLKAENSDYRKGKNALKQAKKYYKKGKIEKAKNRFNDSIKFFTLANKDHPQTPDILNYLGYSFKNIDDFIMAEIYYTQGLEINPLHIGININFGKLYVETNRIDKAKKILTNLESCDCKELQELKSLIQKN